MKRLCLLLGLLTVSTGIIWAGEEYPYGPDSQRQPGVPQGTVTQYSWTSKIFPGTVRDYWVYVPAQYTPDKPACVMLFEDGKGTLNEGTMRVPIVFDNLIAKHEMPVTIAIMINPGIMKGLAPGQADRINRSYEYDGLSDRYAQFLLREILPEVAKHYNLSTNPNDRAICGESSGGICSFTVAWTHTEAFRRVLSYIGSFADLRGGDVYPALIRKTEPKPLRVFLQDGSHDLNNFAGDWWLANLSMASALAYAGYDFKFVTGDKDHDMIQGGPIFPDALRWLWRDYPRPIAKPAMRPLGDAKTGFQSMDTEWEMVANVCQRSPTNYVDVSHAPPVANQWPDPAAIATDLQGNVFVRSASGRAICRIGTDGNALSFADARDERGMVFGLDGRLYGCDEDRITSYAPDGKNIVRVRGVNCKDVAATRAGGLYFSQYPFALVSYLPPGNAMDIVRHPSDQGGVEGSLNPYGVCLSSDQSMLYVSYPEGKWVWSYQVQSDGSLANGEPFFRMETTDEASATGASGMAVDSHGLLYVATLLGIQVCDSEGRVVAIINRPEQASPELGPISGVALGGPDHQYLYIVVGNNVFRKHLAQKPPQP